jgi:hypothetical protein
VEGKCDESVFITAPFGSTLARTNEVPPDATSCQAALRDPTAGAYAVDEVQRGLVL